MNLRPFLLLAFLGTMLFLIGAFITPLKATDDGPGKASAALPGFLREASGLAKVDENQLLIHNDEKGHIYSIAVPSLKITKLVSLGKPVVLDDFEGIAVSGDRIYMITSTGKLYVIPNVSFETTGQIADWRVLDTGLAAVCEVEGLHFEAGKLLIPCKKIYKRNSKKKSGKDRITVYSYIPGKDTEAKTLFSLVDDRLKGDRRRVTAIESDVNFYYLLTPATLLQVHRVTLSLEFFPLDSAAHKQPEGIALMDNGSVYLVDDRKKGVSGLSHYKTLKSISSF
jgi:hypothetical protein